MKNLLIILILIILVLTGCKEDSFINSVNSLNEEKSSSDVIVSSNVSINDCNSESITSDFLTLLSPELLDRIQSNDEPLCDLSNKCITPSETVIYEFPQFTGDGLDEKLNRINKMIEQQALIIREEYVNELCDEARLVYDVKLVNAHFISIQYSYYYFANGAAHPFRDVWTSNIDLDNMEYVSVSNIYNVDYINLEGLIRQGNIINPITTDDITEIYEIAKYMNLKDDLIIVDAPFDLIQDGDTLFTYYTKESVGICFRTRYFLGSYAVFEIPYDVL